jgi:hypothetical protein
VHRFSALRITSLAKAAPAVGYFSSLPTVSVFAGAFTYAVGNVFNVHFASRGTLLNFNPRKVSELFARGFEEGKTDCFAGEKRIAQQLTGFYQHATVV